MKISSKGLRESSSSSSSHHRVKDHETWKNTVLNKERDKLLNEFLMAREELKSQFDCEKRELVGNYERRLRYLRRVLEDCDENINMLKLSLDAEKEQNFILKTRIMEMENASPPKSESSAGNDSGYHGNIGSMNNDGYLNQSFDKDSMATSSHPSSTQHHHRNPFKNRQRKCSVNTVTTTTSYRSYTTTPDKSSIDGLKYSDRMASCGSFGVPESCFTSISTVNESENSIEVHRHKNNNSTTVAVDVHANCRKEFNRLLTELRVKQERFDMQLEQEKERMHEQVQNDKLQLERVIYRQLNARLDREIKKQDLLLTENAHLRRTISNAIMERMQCQCRQPIATNSHTMLTPTKTDPHSNNSINNNNINKNTRATGGWKESNSDSGADVEDNRSEEDDDAIDLACDGDSGKGSLTRDQHATNEMASTNIVLTTNDDQNKQLLQSEFLHKFVNDSFGPSRHFHNRGHNEEDDNINGATVRNTVRPSPKKTWFYPSSTSQTEALKTRDVVRQNDVQRRNEVLREEDQLAFDCLREVEFFKDDLIGRLTELESILTNSDDGAC